MRQDSLWESKESNKINEREKCQPLYIHHRLFFVFPIIIIFFLAVFRCMFLIASLVSCSAELDIAMGNRNMASSKKTEKWKYRRLLVDPFLSEITQTLPHFTLNTFPIDSPLLYLCQALLSLHTPLSITLSFARSPFPPYINDFLCIYLVSSTSTSRCLKHSAQSFSRYEVSPLTS